VRQTFQDLEIVICDNGSTDGTGEIARSFAARDDRVRYVRSERNRGGPWNFNRAFRLSRGDYFKWMAHDDVLAPDFLATSLDLLERDREVTDHNNVDGYLARDQAATGVGLYESGWGRQNQLPLQAADPAYQGQASLVLKNRVIQTLALELSARDRSELRVLGQVRRGEATTSARPSGLLDRAVDLGTRRASMTIPSPRLFAIDRGTPIGCVPLALPACLRATADLPARARGLLGRRHLGGAGRRGGWGARWPRS
jgi:glycosyltransferase involved in cell wall biosynthesis